MKKELVNLKDIFRYFFDVMQALRRKLLSLGRGFKPHPVQYLLIEDLPQQNKAFWIFLILDKPDLNGQMFNLYILQKQSSFRRCFYVSRFC
jgi:hypothetical protein